jgi:hypothetical protein
MHDEELKELARLARQVLGLLHEHEMLGAEVRALLRALGRRGAGRVPLHRLSRGGTLCPAPRARGYLQVGPGGLSRRWTP